jgi:hypothetical protein
MADPQELRKLMEATEKVASIFSDTVWESFFDAAPEELQGLIRDADNALDTLRETTSDVILEITGKEQ